MATDGPLETEVKIRIGSAAASCDTLQTAGFTISAQRIFEANTLFDTPENRLRSGQMLLRLRQAGDHAVITWKGPSIPGPHKSRPELETTVGSLKVCAEILRALGFQPTFRYEKYRTEFRRPQGGGVVTVDETPIGDFLELEGAPSWIDETAAALGFARQSYVLASYGRLYLDYCAAHGIAPTHMVFPGSKETGSKAASYTREVTNH